MDIEQFTPEIRRSITNPVLSMLSFVFLDPDLRLDDIELFLKEGKHGSFEVQRTPFGNLFFFYSGDLFRSGVRLPELKDVWVRRVHIEARLPHALGIMPERATRYFDEGETHLWTRVTARTIKGVRLPVRDVTLQGRTLPRLLQLYAFYILGVSLGAAARELSAA